MAKQAIPEPTEIIQALQSGDVSVLDWIYTTYRADFYRWAGRRFQGTHQDLEDAWQESIIALFESVRDGKLTHLQYALRTWLFAVGFRCLAKYNRKMKRIFWRDTIDEVLLKDTQLLENEWLEEMVDEWTLVETAMQSISPQCRDILVKRFYEGKKIPEIKALLGHNSENTTSASLSRCLRKLKETVTELLNNKK